MRIRKYAASKKTRSRIGTPHVGAKNHRWFSRFFLQVFTSVISPLIVGIALQDFKGCDQSPAQTLPKVVETTPRSQEEEPQSINEHTVVAKSNAKENRHGKTLMYP
jgi:hypothetical protein